MWFLAQEMRPSTRARRELLGVQPHAPHDLLHDALLVVLVVDGEGAREALVADFQRFDVAAQNAHAERVESGDQRLGQRRVAQQPVDALGHLAGGLVGEGDGQNRVGRDAFFLDQPGDAAGDDAGLARAGAGQDEQRALGGFDGGALFGIQIGEERLQGVGPVPSRRKWFLTLVYRLDACPAALSLQEPRLRRADSQSLVSEKWLRR